MDFSVHFRDHFDYWTILGGYIDPEKFMVQNRGVHSKIVSDYRFMGKNIVIINGKEEQISERGYTKIIILSKSRGNM